MDTETKNFKAVKNWIIIVLIITVSSYGIYSGVEDLKYGKEIWTDESKGILIEKCMEDSQDMAVKYRKLTFDYCVCFTEKIQSEFTQQEYIKISEKPIEIQKEKLLPSFKSCLTEYQQKIKEAKTKASAQQNL
tara:strand:+ start:54 stop:452 length:399 start_codon:yes stop_codon:yes gene_type:complete